ncbi:hypothetical protein BH10PSE2_BH10PSE2_14850 [soil metagenome]
MIDRISADLNLLGVAGFVARSDVDELDGFGVAYVLRGSRMGARVLRNRIGADLPTRYMDFTPVLSWRAFLAELEIHAADGDEIHRHRIVTSALQAFAAFSPDADRLA